MWPRALLSFIKYRLCNGMGRQLVWSAWEQKAISLLASDIDQRFYRQKSN